MTTKEQQAIYEAESRITAIFLPSIPARVLLGGEGLPGTALRQKAPVPQSMISSTVRITKASAQEYADFVYSQPWFAAAFPGVEPVTVELKRGGSHCRPPRPGTLEKIIRLGSAHRGSVVQAEWTLLHEMAHAITRAEPPPGDRTHAHHHAWRVHYILLVRKMIGYRAARYLRNAIEQGADVHY